MEPRRDSPHVFGKSPYRRTRLLGEPTAPRWRRGLVLGVFVAGLAVGVGLSRVNRPQRLTARAPTPEGDRLAPGSPVEHAEALVGVGGSVCAVTRNERGTREVLCFPGPPVARRDDLVAAPRVFTVPDVRRVTSGGVALDRRGRFYELRREGAPEPLDLPRDPGHGSPRDVIAGTHWSGYALVALTDTGAVRQLTRAQRWQDISVEGPYRARVLGSSEYHVCANLLDGRVRCWERYCERERGDGIDVPFLALPEVEEIVATPIASQGSLISLACSRNTQGAVACATLIQSPRAWAGAYPFVLRGEIGPARQVAVGSHDICVIERSGQVDCAWGPEHDPTDILDGRGATLRHVPTLDGAAEIALARGLGCARWPEGRVRCWGPFVRSGAVIERTRPAPIPDLDHVDQLLASEDGWCALQRGVLVCRDVSIRENDHQSTVRRPRTVEMDGPITSAAFSRRDLCATLEDGSVACEHGGRLVTPPGGRYRSIAAAGDRLCVLDERSQAWCTTADHNPEDAFHRVPAFDGYEQLHNFGGHQCAWRRGAPLRCVRWRYAIENTPRQSPFEGARDVVGVLNGCVLLRNAAVRCPPGVSVSAPALPRAILDALGGSLRVGTGFRSYFHAIGVNGRVALARDVSNGRGGFSRETALIPGLADAQEVTEWSPTCARRGDRRVLCWGQNLGNTLTAVEADRSPRLVPLRR